MNNNNWIIIQKIEQMAKPINTHLIEFSFLLAVTESPPPHLNTSHHKPPHPIPSHSTPPYLIRYCLLLENPRWSHSQLSSIVLKKRHGSLQNQSNQTFVPPSSESFLYRSLINLHFKMIKSHRTRLRSWINKSRSRDQRLFMPLRSIWLFQRLE